MSAHEDSVNHLYHHIFAKSVVFLSDYIYPSYETVSFHSLMISSQKNHIIKMILYQPSTCRSSALYPNLLFFDVKQAFHGTLHLKAHGCVDR